MSASPSKRADCSCLCPDPSCPPCHPVLPIAAGLEPAWHRLLGEGVGVQGGCPQGLLLSPLETSLSVVYVCLCRLCVFVSMWVCAFVWVCVCVSWVFVSLCLCM